MPEKYRRALPWIGVAVVIVIVAVWLVVWYGNRANAPQGGAASPTPVYAQKGQIIAGFPQELILDSAAQVTNSYTINYSASLNLYTAAWNSSTSMSSLYASYKSYLSANGWTIVNKSEDNSALRAVAATNGTHDMSVVITPRGKGSQVTIAYSTK
jgi:hypothetical protein